MAARVVHGHGRNGLLADRLGDLLVRLHRLAAKEQRRVAVVLDDLGALAVALLKLRERLNYHRAGDVPASHSRYSLLEVRELADVRELVEDEVHVGRQASAVALKRRIAKDVDRLPHEQREQEVEGRVGVAHGCEDACLLPGVSH